MEMIKTAFMIAASLFIHTAANCQVDLAAEKELVNQTIQLYFDGWATGDTTKVGKAMHSTCHLKFFRDGKFTDMDRGTYLSRFKLRERDKDLITQIVLLDITVDKVSVRKPK
jgi:aldose sugar dehydrogenase